MTKTVQGAKGASDVQLYRDSELIAVVPKDDWWVMSATELLADATLQAEGLPFKANEVKGRRPQRKKAREWTTDVILIGDRYDVHLLRSGSAVATMSLDEWAGLIVTEVIVGDIVEAAENLSLYGSSLREVRSAFKNQSDDVA